MNEDIMYRDFDPEIFANKRTAVIDGDGFAYALGWNHKDDLFEDKLRADVDFTIHDILQGTQSEHYVGILSPAKIVVKTIPDMLSDVQVEQLTEAAYDIELIDTPNFRKAIAKTRPYKGNRKEKPEWYDRLSGVIEDQLIAKWGFVRTQPGFEADDMVVTMLNVIEQAGGIGICCGNDKDLRQRKGLHFNVRTKLIDNLSSEQAAYNLYTQVITGDATDSIPGLEGYGPKAAEKILPKGSPEAVLVHAAFTAYLGAYPLSIDTAIQKFYETYMLTKLRTDLSIECHEEELIHGYDLELHSKYNEVQLPEGFAKDEDIPDFLSGE